MLLKLADNANDSGQCFPSIPYIAQQCEIDERTVQRTIQALARGGYLRVERRFHNGRPTSNIYHLSCPPPGGGKLPPSPGMEPPSTPAPCRGDGGTVPPITTTEPPRKESPLPRANRVIDQLALPASLPSGQAAKARTALAVLPIEQQQLVADEWVARLRQQAVRNPLAYLTGLVKRALAGSFVPELAATEQGRREHEQRNCGGTTKLSAAAGPPVSDLPMIQQQVADLAKKWRINS